MRGVLDSCLNYRLHRFVIHQHCFGGNWRIRTSLLVLYTTYLDFVFSSFLLLQEARTACNLRWVQSKLRGIRTL